MNGNIKECSGMIAEYLFRSIRGIRVILRLLRTNTQRARLSPCWKAVTAIEH